MRIGADAAAPTPGLPDPLGAAASRRAIAAAAAEPVGIDGLAAQSAAAPARGPLSPDRPGGGGGAWVGSTPTPAVDPLPESAAGEGWARRVEEPLLKELYALQEKATRLAGGVGDRDGGGGGGVGDAAPAGAEGFTIRSPLVRARAPRAPGAAPAAAPPTPGSARRYTDLLDEYMAKPIARSQPGSARKGPRR